MKDLLRGDPPRAGRDRLQAGAELYGGRVLLEGIEDDPQNFTRFLLGAAAPRRPA